MADPIKIMIVDDQTEFTENIKRLLNLEEEIEVIAEAGSGEEALEMVERMRPDIVLMDADMPGMDGFDATSSVLARFPGVIVIMMAVKREQEHLRKAMLAGAKDFLIKPFSKVDLITTIVTVFSRELRRRTSVPMAGKAGSPAKPVITKHAKVVTLYSIKGGVGKSTVAANLALMMAEGLAPKKTLLLDFDLRFGDIGVILNLVAKHNITSLVHDKNEPGYDSFKRHLAKVDLLDVLLAPFEPQYAEEINGKVLDAIVSSFREHYDYIIIDSPATVNEDIIHLLTVSDMVIVLVTQEITNIKGISTTLKLLEELSVDRGKLRLVINKYKDSLTITKEAISRALGKDIVGIIEDDYIKVLEAINQGQPIVKSEVQSRFISGIQNMVRLIEPSFAKGADEGDRRFSFMGKIKSILGS